MMVSTFEKLFAEVRSIFYHRLATDVGLLTAGQYVAAGLNFVTNVLLARLLGPTDYGLLALIVAYPTLIWSFVGMKSVSVITRYISAFRAKRQYEEVKAALKLAYGIDFVVSLLAFVIVGGSAWWVSRAFYHRPDIAWLMIVYAGSFPFFALTGGSWAALSSYERFKWLSLLEVLHPLMKLLLIVALILAGLGVRGVVIGMALAQAGHGVVMLSATTHLLGREGLGAWWRAPVRLLAHFKGEIAKFFGWNYLLVTLNGLVGQVPVMLLGYFRGPEEAGFYRLANSIATIGSYLETSLGRVVYPTLSSQWATGERETLIVSLKRWTLKIGSLVGITLLFATLLLPILLPLLLGQAYRGMVLGAQVMMLGSVISSVFFWLNSFYYASGRIAYWTIGYAIYTILVLSLSWLAIERWGFLGLVCLVVLGKILFMLLMLVLLSGIKGRNLK
jgi:O-antigen/teichoic acid export membrane protein